MKIGEFETGNVYYEDCIEGMKRIPDQSIEICITDPPYNVNIGSTGYRQTSDKKGKTTNLNYVDDMTHEKYIEFSKSWFKEVSRVCKKVIVTVGETNLITWLKDIAEPIDILYHYKRNAHAPGVYSWKSCIESILLYGKWERKQVFTIDCFNIPLKMKSSDPFIAKLIHPCPKSYELWEAMLIEHVKYIGLPESMLDPFLGSGTTAQLCEKWNIPWIGFELNIAYAHDIEIRINRGRLTRPMKTRQQKVI
jgi:site-specific DNA-methyltransferase (adenine-specific)